MTLDIKSTDSCEFPFDLKIDVSGFFNIKDDEEDKILDLLESKGVQLVYPYVRALATNLTTSALMPPLILPLILPNDFIKC